ncbi:hypothetical protein PORY_001656 [Pneumocystis oryctolagi]|uniref:Uncharacterized protein n=1 Tax=Pneumocystis oryctolagi TaxID=42067 RepID=A0ACB7CB64_9ASCO|nr:hypothetical protein PORY_001656 [Pneumocystis oryctolagi]
MLDFFTCIYFIIFLYFSYKYYKEISFFNIKNCRNKKILTFGEVMSQEKIDALIRLKRLARRTSMFRKFRLKRRYSMSPPFNLVYLQLLNQMIREAAANVDFGIMKSNLHSSIINGNMWSSLEKERFFKSLSRRSRHNPEDIARDVGSKSVMQVIGYMNILEEESRMLRLFSKRHGEVVNLRHIPAAMEMSDEWVNFEEQEAKRIQEWTDKLQERQERVIWGPEWSFLENKKSNEIEMTWNFVNESFSSIQESLFEVSPEIFFLRPKSFIELSEKLFLNKDIDSSRKIVLYRTTLTHMYELARRLTKRLVQAAHFVALSRLRAESSSNFHSQYLVRSKDVQMAVRILGLDRNSHRYWLTLPRRIKMTVLDKNGQELGLDEVEHKLSKMPLNIIRKSGKIHFSYDSFFSVKDKHIDSENSVIMSSMSDDFQSIDNENSAEDLCVSEPLFLNSVQKNDFFDYDSDNLFLSTSENSDDEINENVLVNSEDEFLDALDSKRSIINERKLWRKLSHCCKFRKIDVPSLSYQSNHLEKSEIILPESIRTPYMNIKGIHENRVSTFDLQPFVFNTNEYGLKNELNVFSFQ